MRKPQPILTLPHPGGQWYKPGMLFRAFPPAKRMGMLAHRGCCPVHARLQRYYTLSVARCKLGLALVRMQHSFGLRDVWQGGNPMYQQQPHLPYVPPFDIHHFYLIPVQWLQAVDSIGALDSVHLLAATHTDRSDLLAFSPDEPESYWLRSNPDGLPNLVSHPTYYAWLDQMAQRGWLTNCDSDPAEEFSHSGCYRMSDWPKFDGQGFHYTPRSYIRNRWSRLFVQNGVGMRLAVAGCCALLAHAKAESSLHPVETVASHRQLAQTVSKLLPALFDAEKVGRAFPQLVALGLLSPVTTGKGVRNNRWYSFRADAFAHPPQWPLKEIAERCLLDPIQDDHWVRLIQAFLRFNYLPMEAAASVWSTIRSFDRWLVTPGDVELLLTHLIAKAGRSSTAVKTVLSDFAESQTSNKERYWVDSESVSVSLAGTIARSSSLVIPPPTSDADVTVALSVYVTFERGPRLSLHDAQQELENRSLWISQGDRAWRVCTRIRADRYALTHHLLLVLNKEVLPVRRDEPLRLFVEQNQEEESGSTPTITLNCRLRCFYRPMP